MLRLEGQRRLEGEGRQGCLGSEITYVGVAKGHYQSQEDAGRIRAEDSVGRTFRKLVLPATRAVQAGRRRRGGGCAMQSWPEAR